MSEHTAILKAIMEAEAAVKVANLRIAAALAVCDEWDRLSKGPTATTRRIREALTNGDKP